MAPCSWIGHAREPKAGARQVKATRGAWKPIWQTRSKISTSSLRGLPARLRTPWAPARRGPVARPSANHRPVPFGEKPVRYRLPEAARVYYIARMREIYARRAIPRGDLLAGGPPVCRRGPTGSRRFRPAPPRTPLNERVWRVSIMRASASSTSPSRAGPIPGRGQPLPAIGGTGTRQSGHTCGYSHNGKAYAMPSVRPAGAQGAVLIYDPVNQASASCIACWIRAGGYRATTTVMATTSSGGSFRRVATGSAPGGCGTASVPSTASCRARR